MMIKPGTVWWDLPVGGLILEPGTSKEYLTGSWKSSKPVRDEGKCTNCLICWLFCPDSSILVKDGQVIGIDYNHCKGCGICAKECPPKARAITMVSE